MRAPARHPTPPYAYGPYDADEDYLPSELLADERIGPPSTHFRGRPLLRSLILIMVALGAGWVLLRDPATWWGRAQWLAAQVAALTATMDHKPLPTAQRVSLPVVTPPAPANADPAKTAAGPDRPPLPEAPSRGETAAPPTPPVRSTVAPSTTAGLPPATTEKLERQPPPLPTVDRTDPYQVRAEAVGLHPGLSRALLARLSQADYRNADIAIRKALAETPDDAVLVWPRQRRRGLALFKVHFVPGAASDCRRYVVTVTKDGWATTAQPMERCGAPAGPLRRPAG